MSSELREKVLALQGRIAESIQATFPDDRIRAMARELGNPEPGPVACARLRRELRLLVRDAIARGLIEFQLSTDGVTATLTPDPPGRLAT